MAPKPKPEPVNWTDGVTERLIELYRQNNFLRNIKDPLYSKEQVRTAKLAEFAEELGDPFTRLTPS